VLTACGIRPDIASAAIRMSLGCLTTDACIDRVSEVFPKLVRKARGQGAAARPEPVGA
jgi:cysteine desulfurase